MRFSRMRDVLTVSMAAASVCLMVYTAAVSGVFRRSGKIRPEIKEGASLGGIVLTSLDGSEVGLPNQGRCLVAFLSAGCGACQREVSVLNDAVQSHAYGSVFAVFFDQPQSVKNFVSSYSPRFTCLVDRGGAAWNRLNITGFPQTVELRDGVAVKVWAGLQKSFH